MHRDKEGGEQMSSTKNHESASKGNPAVITTQRGKFKVPFTLRGENVGPSMLMTAEQLLAELRDEQPAENGADNDNN
jgi:hypothetical protein